MQPMLANLLVGAVKMWFLILKTDGSRFYIYFVFQEPILYKGFSGCTILAEKMFDKDLNHNDLNLP